MDKQNMYRYLVNTDGWTVSSKMERYLLLGSAVLKQGSHRFAYYGDALQPFVHYVPFYEDNATDILQAVAWLRSHDKEARAIAEAGREFALAHLNRDSRLCYWRLLMEGYGKLFMYKPTCRSHKICVPILEELKWQAKHVDMCQIHSQLAAILKRTAADQGTVFDPSSLLEGVSLDPNYTHGHTVVWHDEIQG
ncbi:MAG: hypothetical protein WDW38_002667 [Sanguina aurantia]